MIYSLTSSVVVMAVSMTTVTNAYWVPDEAYLSKRQEPTKSNNPEASKTSPPKKETSTKKEDTSTKKEPNASTSKKEPTSKASQRPSATSSHSSMIPTFVGSAPATGVPSSTAISSSSPSASAEPEAGGGSSTGAIVGGVIAAIVAVGGIAAFVILRKRKNARQMSRSNQKPDPFTMGFGSDNYNNNFPPQQSYHKENTATFDNYEVTPISTSNKQAIQQQQSYQAQPPMVSTTTTTAAAANVASLGSFVVIATYIPTLSDELEIETGDRIELVVEYDDGWCQGINLSKGHTKGVFPRHCIDYATAPSHNTSNVDVERSKRVSSMYKP